MEHRAGPALRTSERGPRAALHIERGATARCAEHEARAARPGSLGPFHSRNEERTKRAGARATANETTYMQRTQPHISQLRVLFD